MSRSASFTHLPSKFGGLFGEPAVRPHRTDQLRTLTFLESASALPCSTSKSTSPNAGAWCTTPVPLSTVTKSAAMTRQRDMLPARRHAASQPVRPRGHSNSQTADDSVSQPASRRCKSTRRPASVWSSRRSTRPSPGPTAAALPSLHRAPWRTSSSGCTAANWLLGNVQGVVVQTSRDVWLSSTNGNRTKTLGSATSR